MKLKTIFTLTLFVIVLMALKQPKPYKKAKKQNWMYVKDSILMCAHEMKNGDYQFYLKDLLTNKNMAAYQMALPDTNVWQANDAMLNHQPFVQHYFQHPAYKDFPLVGITHQQAIDYCNWLTNKTNNNTKKAFQKVEICLPTIAEWKLAASASDPNKIYPWKGIFVRNSKGLFQANFRVIGEENLVIDSIGKIIGGKVYKSKLIKEIKGKDTIFEKYTVLESEYNGFITTPVFSYWPNELGLYNMAGNVSELVAEENQYIGGDWFSIAQFLRINNPTRTLDKPLATVGFRYIIKIIEF